MFGGAILGGYALGNMFSPHKSARPGGFTLTPPVRRTSRRQDSDNANESYGSSDESSGVFTGLLSAVEPEIQQLKQLAIGVTLGAIREMLTKQVPPQMAEQVRSIVDGVTRKFGGEPVAATDLPFAGTSSRSNEPSHSSANVG